MKRRILSLLLAACMTVSLLTLPAAASATTSFNDISDHTTAVAAECLRLLGAMDGYGGGTFNPEGQVTRAQFCKMATFVIKDGESQLSRYRTVTVFPDVKPSHWAAPYINLASDASRGATGEDKVDNSIIKGFMDGKFHPERVVTVGQAVTILMRLLGYTDADMGGIWPDGYMASASTVGLTDGLSTVASNPLTRGAAARLFVNLLRSDAKGGGSYGASIAASSVEGMLTTSSATAPDGSDTAMRLGNSTSYSIAGGKVSTGALNGMKGMLLLNKAGKVMTFVPEIAGSSRTVIFASGTAVKLTTASGESFTINGDTAMVVNGEQKTWETGYTMLHSGTSVTLYIGGSGGVEYIFVGVSAASSAAVVVYEKGSTAGFSGLANGSTRYSIYKNGSSATASDMRPYDVAVYNPAENSIRVCDTRITGVYENASPNVTNPSKITLMGTEFSVLPTAADTMSKLKLGQVITLLLTEDNQVAGAVEVGTSGASGNAMGIVQEVSSSSATVNLLCGLTITGKVSLKDSEVSRLKGQLAAVSSTNKGQIGLTYLSGGTTGDLDVSAKKLGSALLAENVTIYQSTLNGIKAISLSQLSSSRIPSSGVLYARTNWAGRVDLLVLTNVTGSDYVYGIAQYGEDLDSDGNVVRTYIEIVGPDGTHISNISGGITSGTFVGVELGKDGSVSKILNLTRFENIANSAWSSLTSVILGGRSYTVPSDALYYNRTTRQWITQDEARAFATTSTVYTDNSGYVRAVEVR
ncbi:S-layer homology domain-containing protein [Oscillibacter sp. GMB15532]|uniref:S-layer homology domain-containing protein n=1 Tax=Oscillibacter sp. GMB15532 TaxID=3230022 RepID=UPI0034DFEC8F